MPTNNIPQIGSSQIPMQPSKPVKISNNQDIPMFDNAPNDVSFGSFFGKLFIGISVGTCVAALLIGTFVLSKSAFVDTMPNILFAVIGLIVCFVGNISLAGLYNLFFNKSYYNFGKMFGLIFTSSIINFLFFIIFYVLFSDPFVIFGFQVIFSTYITSNLLDFMAQPNYSASSLIGNTLGCLLSVAIFLSVLKSENQILILISSAFISYSISILGSGIWNAIYYQMYEWGNNPFYLQSLNELREERRKEELRKQKEEEDVNVEMN